MRSSAPLRLAFVLGRIELGGAEMMLWKLLSRIDRARFEPTVVALSAEADAMLERFQSIGIPCHLLGMKTPVDVFAIVRLSRILAKLRPDIVQGWMYYGNVAAILASGAWRRRWPVFWNVRGTLVDASRTSLATALSIWVGGRLSGYPAKIINNSMTSALEHERRYGYDATKRVILPNGFDTGLFRPSADARRSFRDSLGLPRDALLIGLLGRYHPMKEHALFLRAACSLSAGHPGVHYVLAGDRVDTRNVELRSAIEKQGLLHCVHLLGRRDDMHIVCAALDICALSSSSGEGFPNVVGEAMSCGVPCVVTDVGDSSRVIGDTGITVPPRDAQALARALGEMVKMEEGARRELGARARQRIVDHFSLDAVVRQYEDVYSEIYLNACANQA